MSIELSWPWLGLLLLGALHGVNPGMGWLFAVALGLQERKRLAVWRALLPLAMGHALAIGVAIVLAAALSVVAPPRLLRWLVAAALLGVGLFHLSRRHHLRGSGMRVGMRDLTLWSFLMASAHGAGLMVLPFLVGGGPASLDAAHVVSEAQVHQHDQPASGVYASTASTDVEASHAGHVADEVSSTPNSRMAGVRVALVHTMGYLLATGLLAMLVYEWLGLRMLTRLWLNLDLVWVGTLFATAVLTPLL